MSCFLGIDPSLTATGWIIFDGNRVDFGCIRTEPEQKKRHTFKSDDTTRRLTLILLAIQPKIDVELDGIACEQPAGAQNAAAAAALGEVHGALVGMFHVLAVDELVRWIPARDAKLALTGHYSASKPAMMLAAAKWLGKNTPMATDSVLRFSKLTKRAQEAVADALGVLLASKLVKGRE